MWRGWRSRVRDVGRNHFAAGRIRWHSKRLFNRFIADLQSDHLFEWQHMRAAQIKVRVRRRTTMREAHVEIGASISWRAWEAKSAKVRATDRRKEQRVRLGGNNSCQSRINRHGLFSRQLNNQLLQRLRLDDALEAWVNSHDSQPRVNRLALQCQHAKDSFMHSAQRFFANESFECFDAECEFAKSQRTFRGKAARTQAFEIFCRRVFRAIDDAEILAATALHSGLYESTPTLGDELQ